MEKLNNIEHLKYLHERLKRSAIHHGFRKFVTMQQMKRYLLTCQNDEVIDKAFDCRHNDDRCPAIVALLFFIKSQHPQELR